MGMALGKYVTVMCLDFKEDDTRLYCPVTFWIFTSQKCDCRVSLKSDYSKKEVLDI